jgi:alkanesulfonate monooxygenase SsuD/methylene tetrahydromethanopterin reductase-like flavin-dependent oxidoreductase (luciferase family)
MAVRVGLSVTPLADALDDVRAVVRAADAGGLDLVGVQDHPYQRRFADTWMLMAALLTETERITVFPDVANLPLRPPAVMAKSAATLDLLSGGRFELGLGAGGFWDAIVAMGGPRRTPPESVDALEEAIAVIRLMWSGERSVSFEGKHYRVDGLHPGPEPAHDIGIWLGAYKPRMLRVIGRLADGWVPSLGYATPDDLRAGNARIDEAAAAAGRDPARIRRVVNVSGAIDDAGAGGALDQISDLSGDLAGPPSFWIDTFGQLEEIGFDSVVFWPREQTVAQVERLADCGLRT